MIALSFVGIVVALSFVCVTMYRGWSPLVAVPCGAVILALFSGMNPGDALVGPFMKQTCNLFNTIGPLFMTGSMLASTMEHTGSARSIASFLSKTFGVKNCCWVILIVAGLLSYGGMSLGGYLIVFPIAVYLVKQANYDRNIVLGLILGGSWSFASWGPFAPSTGNIYIQNAMGTPSSAGLIPGMVALVVDIVILGFYFQWQAKRWQKQGRFYEDDSTVAVDENEMERTAATDPNLIVSLIPPILVIVLYNVVKLNIAVSCTLAWLA